MGFLMGLLTQSIFIGYSIVEAFVFMLAFNHLAPWVKENLFETLPITSVPYLVILSIFILINYIGRFIVKLTPKIVSIENNHKEVESK